MMSIQKIKEDLKKKLSSKRYEHTMGVEYTSTCLAMRYGADIEKARLAGLLHDCAKYLSSEEKLSECERYGIPVSAYERNGSIAATERSGMVKQKMFAGDLLVDFYSFGLCGSGK